MKSIVMDMRFVFLAILLAMFTPGREHTLLIF